MFRRVWLKQGQSAATKPPWNFPMFSSAPEMKKSATSVCCLSSPIKSESESHKALMKQSLHKDEFGSKSSHSSSVCNQAEGLTADVPSKEEICKVNIDKRRQLEHRGEKWVYVQLQGKWFVAEYRCANRKSFLVVLLRGIPNRFNNRKIWIITYLDRSKDVFKYSMLNLMLKNYWCYNRDSTQHLKKLNTQTSL